MRRKNRVQLSVKQSENKALERAEWNGRFRTTVEVGVVDALEGVGRTSSSVSPASNTTAASGDVFAERSWRSW